jgi:Bacterial Ig-like domain
MVLSSPGRLALAFVWLATIGDAAALHPASTPASPEPVDWIVEDGSTLTLRLVRDEGYRICGGELTVDSASRTVRFVGAPGAIGCRTALEASFEEVKALRVTRREAGFVLEVPARKAKLILIPLPHFHWFDEQRRMSVGTRDVENQLNAAGVLRGNDRDPVSLGGSAAPILKHTHLPAEVVADTQKAVDLVREAMGRTPAPGEMLREILQGRPLEASLGELVQEPGTFSSAPVRVRARLVRAESPSGFRLDADGVSLAIQAAPGAEASFGLVNAWVDQDVELVGRLRPLEKAAGSASADEHYLQAWECIGPDTVMSTEGTSRSLSQLLAGMKEHEGEVVRVVGRFRGRNLHGDLPPASRRSTDDWVIKSERAAIWVTGHKPGAEGWTLDLDSPSSQWVEVVGRPRVRDGVAYLRAMKVALVSTPAGARVVPARRLRGRNREPPSVVFSLPLEGEAVSSTTRIVVQFDRDMDEESFKDRIRLREEAGGEVAARLVYDESRRSVVISPLRPLRPGRPLRVELLPGIVDLEGMPLAPRPGRAAAGEVVDVLRYGSEGD